MCGLFGGFNLSSKLSIDDVNTSVGHRGPDATNIFHSPSCSLGHSLLTIRDTNTPRFQPFEIDLRWIVAYNGEIYRVEDPELNKILNSGSSYEHQVIELAFRKYGLQALHLLKGMFAISVYDAQHNTITLARDGSGQKPLYFSFNESNKQLIWSSELCLQMNSKLSNSNSNEINLGYLESNLGFGFSCSDTTVLPGVNSVKAGEIMTFNAQGVTTSDRIETKSYKDGDFTLAQILNDVLRNHLLADTPLAISLSGGLDSATIAGFSHKNGISLSAFSTYFVECPQEFNWDFYRAEKLAKNLNHTFYTVEVTPETYLLNLESSHKYLDDPVYNQSLPAYLQLIQEVHQNNPRIRVLFSGAGGDELFGGYPHHLKWHQQTLIRSIISSNLFDLLYKIKNDQYPANNPQEFWKCHRKLRFPQDVISIESTKLSRSIDIFHETKDFANSKTSNNHLLDLDYTWLMADNLQYLDRFGLRNQIECRAPFTDYALRLWCRNNLRPIELFNLRKSKLPLEIYSRDVLPKWFFDDLKKKGWSAPLKYWYENGEVFREYFHNYFNIQAATHSSNFIDFKKVTEIIDREVSFPGKWLIYLYSLSVITNKLGLTL